MLALRVALSAPATSEGKLCSDVAALDVPANKTDGDHHWPGHLLMNAERHRTQEDKWSQR